MLKKIVPHDKIIKTKIYKPEPLNSSFGTYLGLKIPFSASKIIQFPQVSWGFADGSAVILTRKSNVMSVHLLKNISQTLPW